MNSFASIIAIGDDSGLAAGAQRAPAIDFSPFQIAQIAVTALLVALAGFGVDLGTSAITGAGGVFILVLGLPHGAIDSIWLSRAGSTSHGQALAFGLYIAAGLAMASLWWLAPAFALSLFFVIAVVHFGEDWSGIDSPLLSYGAALGLLGAPTILHGDDITRLLVMVSGQASSAIVASILTLVAPVAFGCALVANAMLWRGREKALAVAGFVALFGLVMLPPIAGFALFFCLYHSPRHFAAAIAGQTGPISQPWAWPIVLTTAAALALAAGLYWFSYPPSVPVGLVRTCFITISALTIPHMLLPRVLALRGFSSLP